MLTTRKNTRKNRGGLSFGVLGKICRHHKRTPMRRLFFSLLLFASFGLGTSWVFISYRGGDPLELIRQQVNQLTNKQAISPTSASQLASGDKDSIKSGPLELIDPNEIESHEPTAEAKQAIADEPPLIIESSKMGTPTKTISNSDGSKTVIVAEGQIDQQEIDRIAGLQTLVSKPSDLQITDETGKYALLSGVLKSYLNARLRWSNEISALREVVIKDAGPIGWSGLYAGSYTIDRSGDIIEAYGWITINTHYFKDSPYFTDYVKLVFAHEYGHHYTQYYKWVAADLDAGSRFPNSYYEARSVPKDGIMVNCSKSWVDCDSEIIAEDYSYLYSGYGYHAMRSEHGLPGELAMKNWLDNIAANIIENSQDSLAPSVIITSPPAGIELSGTVKLAASAEDDKAVSRVNFFINDSLVSSVTASPYQTTVDTTRFDNGSYLIRAVAYDTNDSTADVSIAVSIKNSLVAAQVDDEIPVVAFTKPNGDSYNWIDGNLILEAIASDNTGVVKIEIYINGNLSATSNAMIIARRWKFITSPAGEYLVTAKAYDVLGNVGETSIKIIKS
ncbi:MAG: Chitodextrinase precursor [bacterium ADurb.Bin400]|nr:MAG: Chitodextrinase precursor [bacterium ADurb.Bin400]